MRRYFVLAQLVFLGACAPPKTTPVAAPQAALPTDVYAQAERNGDTVYRVLPHASLVTIHVGKSGPMQRFGHEHVIASKGVTGYVWWDSNPAIARADLEVPLASLIVDAPVYRARAGLDADVPASAIEDTTRNMQDKVLHSKTFPLASIAIVPSDLRPGFSSVRARMTLHGVVHEYVVPVTFAIEAHLFQVTGAFTIAHSDFALTPFSAAGGLLSVAEHIDIQFELVATR